jgi:hypothetical protein
MQAPADRLPLPTLPRPEAFYVDGMRVTTMYSIGHDRYLARFDTIIDGTQRSLGYELSDLRLLDTLSGRAKRRFLAGEGTLGKFSPLFEGVSA